jgi:hypothetical protein
MKIAYYEENNFHTEIIATFLYNHKDDEICIFNNDDISTTINSFVFADNYKIFNKDLFDLSKNSFDRIYISYSHTTDDIYKSIENKDKVYVICHLKSEIKPEFKNVIVLTPINHTPGKTHYILPIHGFNIKTRGDNSKKINNICVIGRFKDNNRDYKDIIKFVNHKDNKLKIQVFSRHPKFIPKEIYDLQKKTPQIISILTKTSTYILNNYILKSNFIFTNVAKDSCYYNDRLTGMIPLAFNLKVPLIMDSKLREIYNIKSCIEYKDSITEVINKISSMTEEEYNTLVSDFMIEKNIILEYNNEQFRKFR